VAAAADRAVADLHGAERVAGAGDGDRRRPVLRHGRRRDADRPPRRIVMASTRAPPIVPSSVAAPVARLTRYSLELASAAAWSDA
jgi:hypothetical protein